MHTRNSQDVVVNLVTWPRDADLAETLRAAGLPRLLMVADHDTPPICTDELQDWVRVPADPIEVNVRLQALQRRASRLQRPSIDENGHLAVADQWVTLTPIETSLMRVLVANFDKVVARAEVAAAWPDEDTNRNQLELRLRRLRVRVRPLGLCITSFRGRGHALQWVAGQPCGSLASA